MNRKDYLDKVNQIHIDKGVEKKIISAYGNHVPEFIIKAYSYSQAPELFDENESRTLSLNEIVNAEKDFCVSFNSVGIIPFIEVGCDDYIVYDINMEKWCLYNIIDEVLFDRTECFSELFLR